MPVTELPQVCPCGSAVFRKPGHWRTVAALPQGFCPLVEVLVSAVFGKISLAAEVLLCWWSVKLSCCTPASPLALLFGQQGSGTSRWNWGEPGQVNSTL
ncbi:uncharacterized protein isoform X1 [Salmo salar]|uniref:Uncharacterized protein isoform X1 n=1 Tax=Salmo salar TaxID=8030 RepID=A0A1S3NA76_SALSA|nr:uncharacterized protein LOC106578090 isoform X1 [Salmo salar]|eukprot:XP_014012153.1 PREDICTED: uncharacterized protein LOC106578090 isoform X1 [Salmo salar]